MTPEPGAPSDGELLRPASPMALFWAFTTLALQGFGGVLPVAQRILVDQRRWMSRAQFLELLSVSQVLPGPNIVNLCVTWGDRQFGWRGALAACAGILLAPLAVVLLLTIAADQFRDIPAVDRALHGMGIAAAGLVVAMALKLLAPLRKNPLGWPLGLALALLCAALVGIGRWPMLQLVVVVGLPAMALAWWKLRR